ncbi:putative phenylalanine ammonia-lyase [Aspergillus steynii IBT 23096]|uniref:Putative phenylalanine ammonia-lyase n=1 Tax=Aspergillus steynii IBT 23096 TaxID=1392250 RepID=A0A2I2GAA4_9EURO|nr:putative phenylalanine ammonia-lyase [Aspergillus steynii IBT 23096]PLB49807.1 putative phenylalanine ammonia-lyase [Aspergillus steynii IBT 23096]
MSSHLNLVKECWADRESLLKDRSQVVLDGDSLSLGAVVAVSRNSTKALIKESEDLYKRVQDSIKTLTISLGKGEQVYGVNTGPGGNAATRTRRLEMLQHSFLQHHQCGILTDPALNGSEKLVYQKDLSDSLPVEVVRGTMLLRCNSLLRGHSAVRVEVIELLLCALNNNMTPVVPLRGSISASGDLSPLSYLGGLIEGNPDIFVQVKENDRYRILSAKEALEQMDQVPMTLNAKEGLGIMNGTAPSAAAASLTLYDSHNLALLTQVLTAMATEALMGTVDNYHDFISQCRPHQGQAEVARNIRSFLSGSRLSPELDVNKVGLIQDRYALRTAPQWIGPQLEDLLSATRQIEVEINSSTDNPLIDIAEGRFHHGGNFQAASVTSAMEKTRTALVMLGRLLLAQCGELTNPMISRGLPPNLCADDPSLSFAMKGLDVHMTAYFSELGFLANSVASHVQTAEMNNQSVNSLALISCRYTRQSVEILSMMCAAHLYILCQALDLRALMVDFLQSTQTQARPVFEEEFGAPKGFKKPSFEEVWMSVESAWLDTSQLDLVPRCEEVASRSVGHIVNTELNASDAPDPSVLNSTKAWKAKLSSLLYRTYSDTRTTFFTDKSTPRLLGQASKAIYLFVREGLGVPFHQGVTDHPVLPNYADCQDGKKTIGSYVTRIYESIRDGEIIDALKCVV